MVFIFSFIVLPPQDDFKADLGQSGRGNVTQPFVTETYCCVAAYETKDTKNKPFKVAPDEKLDVLIKDKAGKNYTTVRHSCVFWACGNMGVCWDRMVAGGE